METTIPERRFRQFILTIVFLMCVATLGELVLEKHYKAQDQLIPFVLTIAALVTTAAALIRPGKATIWVLRIVMLGNILGSLLGGLEHLKANYEFVTDIQPNIAFGNALLTAFSGAAPLLAPGILALAGILAIVATLYYPGLRRAGATSPGQHSA